MTDDPDALTDAEWSWISTFLLGVSRREDEALRGYLNDRITERVVGVQAETRTDTLAGEHARIAALTRMLLDSGDITPMAARILTKKAHDGSE